MSSLIIYQTLQRGLHQRGLAWAVVVVTRSFLSWVGAFKQRSIRRGQRRPLRATVSWWDLICTGVPVWAAMPCSDPACRLRQPNPASGLNSIDQVRTQSSLRDYRRGRVRARTRVCVSCAWQSHRNGAVGSKTWVAISWSGREGLTFPLRSEFLLRSRKASVCSKCNCLVWGLRDTCKCKKIS